MKVRRSMLRDVVTVATRRGESSYGDVVAPKLWATCLVDETRRLIRGGDGQQTVSEASLLLHPETQFRSEDGARFTDDPATRFTLESAVEINGRTSHVLSVKVDRQRGYAVAVTVMCA